MGSHIRNFRVSDQPSSLLFTKLPTEVYHTIIKEWEDLPNYERVLLNLVCKRFANDLPVRRGLIPRIPGTQGRLNPTAPAYTQNLALAATAPKRARLNFLQRLAPWFDHLTFRNNLELRTIEECRKQSRHNDVLPILVVDDAWVLCVACLKYVRAHTVMLDVNAAEKLDPDLPGNWSRCVIPRRDEPNMHIHGERLDLTNVEKHWTHLPVTPDKVPGYFNPKTKLKKMVKRVDTPVDRKGKGKAREKVDAPEKFDGHGRDGKNGGGGGRKAKEKAPEDLTGYEECVWLPVDILGERTPVFAVCPIHTFDPINFVGM